MGEGQAKVKAAKEKEAQHALQKERIQHGKDIQHEIDARKKAEHEKISLESRNENLTGKIHSAEHEKIVCEGDNKQLKSDLSQTNFMFERETRENLRQLEDIKRNNKVLVDTQSLDFKRQLDNLKHIAKEKEQELKEIIEKKEAEIQKLNGNIADKDVEIQTMEVNHDKEIRENTDKMRKKKKKKKK